MIDKDSLYFTFLDTSRRHYLRTHSLLGEIGVYHGQPPLLCALEENDGLSQRELADILNIAPSTITVMLKRMEKAGLIFRKQDSKDQRVSRVYLTEEGKIKCIKAKEAINDLSKECFKDFSLEEKERLKQLLEKMGKNLKEQLE